MLRWRWNWWLKKKWRHNCSNFNDTFLISCHVMTEHMNVLISNCDGIGSVYFSIYCFSKKEQVEKLILNSLMLLQILLTIDITLIFAKLIQRPETDYWLKKLALVNLASYGTFKPLTTTSLEVNAFTLPHDQWCEITVSLVGLTLLAGFC